MCIEMKIVVTRLTRVFKKPIAIGLLATAAVALELQGGTVISNNLPTDTAIVNIDAQADGSAAFNGDQSLWYQPFNTSGTLLEYTIQPGSYNFRVIDPADASREFPALTSLQTNQIFTGWTFNSPWTTDYLVFDSAAVTNKLLPQLFDGAFSNTNGGSASWTFYPDPLAAYRAAISNGFAGLLRTGASGGRNSTDVVTSYTFPSATTLVFAVPDNGLFDNQGGVSVLVSPLAGPTGPALTIEPAMPGAVRLIWPTNELVLNLQFNSNLASTNWMRISQVPSVLGLNNVVTNYLTNGPVGFYRLSKP